LLAQATTIISDENVLPHLETTDKEAANNSFKLVELNNQTRHRNSISNKKLKKIAPIPPFQHFSTSYCGNHINSSFFNPLSANPSVVNTPAPLSSSSSLSHQIIPSVSVPVSLPTTTPQSSFSMTSLRNSENKLRFKPVKPLQLNEEQIFSAPSTDRPYRLNNTRMVKEVSSAPVSSRASMSSYLLLRGYFTNIVYIFLYINSK
jgi:hypothetical protein